MNGKKSELSTIQVLYLEQNPADVTLIKELLSQSKIANFEITRVTSLQDMENYKTENYDIALINLSSSDGQSIENIVDFRKENKEIPIVAITDIDDEITTVTAIQAGVQDCLVKGKFDTHLLIRTLFFAMEREQSITMLADLKSQQEKHFLTHDQLTGLPNKKYLIERLDQKLKEDKHRNMRFTIVQFKLEGLQQVNNTLGLSFGDALLQLIAKRLKEEYANEDSVVRFDSNLFVILLTNDADETSIEKFVHGLLMLLREPIDIYGEQILVTTSVGISRYPEDALTSEDLIQKAVMAAEAARKLGRHNFRFYSSEMKEQAEEYHVLQHDLQTALENKELFLLYQPKVEFKSGNIVGVEALLRWQHARLGLIPPAHFIPIAETTNLIVPIGMWVIQTCLELVKHWQSKKLGINIPRIAVNVSPVQLEQGGFVESIRSTLASYHDQTQFIEFEITENAIMRNPDEAIAILNEIRELGIPIAIDDFGTGYSSLSYLKSLPADIVKIDQVFIRDVHINIENAEIVKSTINMVHNLGLTVIAEGIETEEEMKFLKENHCDYMQGYYFSRPISKEKLLTLIQETNKDTN